MARALALTAECLDCAAGSSTTGDAGVTGPSILPRIIPLREPTIPSGGLPIVPGTTGDRPVRVIPGTSALPSTTGPQVQPRPPAAEPTAGPGLCWKCLVAIGVLLGLLAFANGDKRGAR